jgi:catechol 2,3-dioxygenase-like lactoylglutathione lyase family enzyme
MDYSLEVVVIPASDVDRSNAFYQSLGWRLDADVAAEGDFRLVQVTPPGSSCSIQFGTGLTTAAPGSTRATDPDGNEWVLQEITTRLPGR